MKCWPVLVLLVLSVETTIPDFPPWESPLPSPSRSRKNHFPRDTFSFWTRQKGRQSVGRYVGFCQNALFKWVEFQERETHERYALIDFRGDFNDAKIIVISGQPSRKTDFFHILRHQLKSMDFNKYPETLRFSFSSPLALLNRETWAVKTSRFPPTQPAVGWGLSCNWTVLSATSA